jgi:hypothetical protein
LNTDRIDVHTHLIPPFWAEELKNHGGDPSGWGSPESSPDSLLRFMDDEGIRISVLSLTAPGIEGWRADERVKMARRVNDYGVDLVQKTLIASATLRRCPFPTCTQVSPRWLAPSKSLGWMAWCCTAISTAYIWPMRDSFES